MELVDLCDEHGHLCYQVGEGEWELHYNDLAPEVTLDAFFAAEVLAMLASYGSPELVEVRHVKA